MTGGKYEVGYRLSLGVGNVLHYFIISVPLICRGSGYGYVFILLICYIIVIIIVLVIDNSIVNKIRPSYCILFLLKITFW